MYGPVVTVIGGDGFVGGHVARQLTKKNIQCRAAFSPGQSRWQLADVDCLHEEVDPKNSSQLAQALTDTAGVIYCPLWPFQKMTPAQAKRRSVAELRRVFEACAARRVGRVVYISSASTMIDGEPADKRGYEESQVFIPGSTEDSFFEARAAMEAEAYRYVSGGMDVTMLLTTTVIGPGDVNRVSSPLMESLATGWEPPEGDDDGEPTINLVDARDVAEAAVAALQRGRRGRRYAVAGQNLRRRRLMELIADLPGGPSTVRQPSSDRQTINAVITGLGDRMSRIFSDRSTPSPVLKQWQRAVRIGPISNQRLRGELGITPRRPKQSLSETVQWLERIGWLGWQQGKLCRLRVPNR